MTESISTSTDTSSNTAKSGKLYNLDLIKDKASFYDLALYFNEKKVKVSYNSVTMCCPFHKDDSPSFSYSIENKFYFCFGCKAHGDIFSYIQHKLNNTSFRESVQFVVDFFKLDDSDLPEWKQYRPNYKKKVQNITKYLKQADANFTLYNDQDIKSMMLLRGTLFEDKGFTKETLDFFEVGFDQRDKRVVIPIRDENGKLIGLTGRSLLSKEQLKAQNIPKWRHYQNSNTKETLFNIHNAIKYSREGDGSVIITEGPSDVMKMHQFGFKNTVGCLGNVLTQGKKGLLLRNFVSVYIFLDADEGGETGATDMIKKLKGYFTLYKVTGPDGKDPADMTAEEVKYSLSTAIKVT